jgi:hypothetical protein
MPPSTLTPSLRAKGSSSACARPRVACIDDDGRSTYGAQWSQPEANRTVTKMAEAGENRCGGLRPGGLSRRSQRSARATGALEVLASTPPAVRAVGDCLPLIAHKTKPRGSRPPGLSPSSGLLPDLVLWLCRQRSGNSSSAIASSPPHGPLALMTVRGERPGHRYFGPTTAHTYTSSVSTSVISPAAAAARTSSSDRNWCGANPALKTIRT